MNEFPQHEFLIGIAKADITGPIAEQSLIGYGKPMQIASGLHMRLFAKSFIRKLFNIQLT